MAKKETDRMITIREQPRMGATQCDVERDTRDCTCACGICHYIPVLRTEIFSL